jgi:hypothetical protein
MNKSTFHIARIFNQRGVPCGAGLLISEKEILTCAHVVSGIVGRDRDPRQSPQTSIVVDLPHSNVTGTLTAYTDLWDQANDIAVLTLSKRLRFDLPSVSLIIEEDLWDNPFRAFGFPEGYDNGVWASGVLRGHTASNWLQIECKSGSGYIVQPGFSGSPVFDDHAGGIVGMITTADLNPDIRAAYLIPSDVLVKVVPALKSIVSGPIISLGQLHGISRAELHRKLDFHRDRLSSGSKAGDLLSVSLLLVTLRSFDEAIRFLERFLARKPLHAYGWYALALASLKGKRPRLLTYDIASSIHKQVLKAVQLNPDLIQAALLLAVLTADYFESKGFKATPDLRTCLRLVENKPLKRKEILALLRLISNDPSIPLVDAIQSAIL